jgi:uncharacterized protein (TIGR02300 family)
MVLTAAGDRGNDLPNFSRSSRLSMSTKTERGTKRTCQSPECGSRFYDLSRNPIVCPICQSAYRLEASPAVLAAAAQAAAERAAARKSAKKPVFAPPVSPKPEAAEGDDELVVIEGDDEEAGAAGEDDETFLEAEEEDGSDMSNIIGGPVAEKDEQT